MPPPILHLADTERVRSISVFARLEIGARGPVLGRGDLRAVAELGVGVVGAGAEGHVEGDAWLALVWYCIEYSRGWMHGLTALG